MPGSVSTSSGVKPLLERSTFEVNMFNTVSVYPEPTEHRSGLTGVIVASYCLFWIVARSVGYVSQERYYTRKVALPIYTYTKQFLFLT